MLGPYNYVVCKNCFKKQDLHGQSCVHCGYRLLVEVVDRNLGKTRQNINDTAISE
jgi:DNA-directed RNA polymerase subunit RPC12/RpoP